MKNQTYKMFKNIKTIALNVTYTFFYNLKHVLHVRNHYYIASGHAGSKSIPVVWTHATVDHTDVFGYGLYFVNTLLIIQYRFLLLFRSQNNTV